jgi:hypothetical protein
MPGDLIEAAHACYDTGELRRTLLLDELLPFPFGREQLGASS